jgi:hypothetical protein
MGALVDGPWCREENGFAAGLYPSNHPTLPEANHESTEARGFGIPGEHQTGFLADANGRPGRHAEQRPHLQHPRIRAPARVVDDPFFAIIVLVNVDRFDLAEV